MSRTNNFTENKNFREKQAYINGLLTHIIDKTDEDKENILNTGTSTIDNPNEKPPKDIRKKKWLLRIKDGDFINSNFFFPLIVGSILALISMLWNLSTGQNKLEGKFDSVSEKINESINKNEDNTNKIIEIDKNFAIFKTEYTKDLEYIKEKLNLI